MPRGSLPQGSAIDVTVQHATSAQFVYLKTGRHKQGENYFLQLLLCPSRFARSERTGGLTARHSRLKGVRPPSQPHFRESRQDHVDVLLQMSNCESPAYQAADVPSTLRATGARASVAMVALPAICLN